MKKLGLIAGNGKFPLIFAEQARKEGYSLVAVAHRGETVKEIEDLLEDVTWIYVGQLGKMIRTFLRAGITEAVMAGGIHKVKFLENFRPDLRGVKFLARIKSKDDDALLRGVAEELESEGIKILNSTLCVPQIVASEGVLTRRAPSAATIAKRAAMTMSWPSCARRPRLSRTCLSPPAWPTSPGRPAHSQ